MARDQLPEQQREQVRAVGVASGLGCSVVVSLIVFIGAGVLLDQRFDLAPIFTLIGVAIGLFAAGYQLYELTLLGREDRANGPVGRTIARGLSARKQNRSR